MLLLAHDTDDNSVYEISVNKDKLIQLLRTEFAETLGTKFDQEILDYVKSMSPEDIDGAILGTLQNQKATEYKVKLIDEMD